MKRTSIYLAILIGFPGLVWAQSIKDINVPTVKDLDQVTEFHEGLAAVRKGANWGFIDQSGKLVIEFRDDLVWSENPVAGSKGVRGMAYPRFSEGRCPVRVFKEDEPEIPFYGFIDKAGKTVIQPDFLNITEFRDGIALGIFFKKTFRGKNNFQLNIYDYSFTEVVINTAGEMIWPLAERENIMMEARRYQTPALLARILSPDLIAVETETAPRHWEIRKIKR